VGSRKGDGGRFIYTGPEFGGRGARENVKIRNEKEGATYIDITINGLVGFVLSSFFCFFIDGVGWFGFTSAAACLETTTTTAAAAGVYVGWLVHRLAAAFQKYNKSISPHTKLYFKKKHCGGPPMEHACDCVRGLAGLFMYVCAFPFGMKEAWVGRLWGPSLRLEDGAALRRPDDLEERCLYVVHKRACARVSWLTLHEVCVFM
jgi:hypothetical protein